MMEPNVEVTTEPTDSCKENTLVVNVSAGVSNTTKVGAWTSTNFKLDIDLAVWIGLYNVINYLPCISCDFSSSTSPSLSLPIAGAVPNAPAPGDDADLEGAQNLMSVAAGFGHFNGAVPPNDLTVSSTGKSDQSSVAFSESYQIKNCMLFSGYYGVEINDIKKSPGALSAVAGSLGQLVCGLPSLFGFLTDGTSAGGGSDTAEEALDKAATEKKIYTTVDTAVAATLGSVSTNVWTDGCGKPATVSFSEAKCTRVHYYNDEKKEDQFAVKYAWKGKAEISIGETKYSCDETELFSCVLPAGKTIEDLAENFISSPELTFSDSASKTLPLKLCFRVSQATDTVLSLTDCIYSQTPKVTFIKESQEIAAGIAAGQRQSEGQITTNGITLDNGVSADFAPDAQSPAIIGSDYALAQTGDGYSCTGITEIFTWMKKNTDHAEDVSSDWHSKLTSSDASATERKIAEKLGYTSESTGLTAYRLKPAGGDGTSVKCGRLLKFCNGEITVDISGYELELQIVLFRYGTKCCGMLALDSSRASAAGYNKFRFGGSLTNCPEPGTMVSEDLKELLSSCYTIYAVQSNYSKVGLDSYSMALDFFRICFEDRQNQFSLRQMPITGFEDINSIIKDTAGNDLVFKFLGAGPVAAASGALASVATGAMMGYAATAGCFGKSSLLLDADRNGRGTFFSYTQNRQIFRRNHAAGSSSVMLSSDSFAAGTAGKITLQAGDGRVKISSSGVDASFKDYRINVANGKISISKGEAVKFCLKNGRAEISFAGRNTVSISQDGLDGPLGEFQ